MIQYKNHPSLHTQTTKVRSRSFVGCISDAYFDHRELNLWQPTSQEGSVLCCQRPASPPPAQPDTTPGISFSGFGYLQVRDHYISKGQFMTRYGSMRVELYSQRAFRVNSAESQSIVQNAYQNGSSICFTFLGFRRRTETNLIPLERSGNALSSG